MSAHVVILTKAPVPGRVKTRLIPALGAAGAARFHEALVEITLDLVAASGLEATVSLSGGLDSPFADRIRARDLNVKAQADGDLGARLRHALRGPGRCIAIGTDCPLLDPAALVAAARAPEPVVVGPAEDGGYWMIAVDAPQDSLFTDIPWSSPETLAVTLQRARGEGLAVRTAEMRYDIDTPGDLKRLLADPRCPPVLRAVAQS
jgi:rSAM/selenodomain-associated transferase 1